MIKRSINIIEVAYFLSKYGQSDPPRLLQTHSWNEAYRMFYEGLSNGREIVVFENSLKNARDAFDGHFLKTAREGWKDKNGNPQKLNGLNLEVFAKFNNMTEDDIWQQISKYANLGVSKYESVFENLIGIQESEKEENRVKTEGGTRVFISTIVERNPSLRNNALKIHGYDCMVCGFNFGKTYGSWGKDWAEVHHLTPISENKNEKKQTDPKTDLAVLCANCHRMIHCKKGIVLTIMELKNKMNLL